MKVFLYGEKGVGKSTIIKDVLSNFQGNTNGFVTDKLITDTDENAGIYIFDIKEKDKKPSDENRVGICGLDSIIKSFPDIFDDLGVKALTFKDKPDLVIMDELGVLERRAEKFKGRVFEILDEDINVIGVIKDKSDSFLNSIKQRGDVYIYKVDKQNRDSILIKIKESYDIK